MKKAVVIEISKDEEMSRIIFTYYNHPNNLWKRVQEEVNYCIWQRICKKIRFTIIFEDGYIFRNSVDFIENNNDLAIYIKTSCSSIKENQPNYKECQMFLNNYKIGD